MPNEPTHPALVILARLNRERRDAKRLLTIAALDLHNKIDRHLAETRAMSRAVPVYLYDETDTGAEMDSALGRFNYACTRALDLRHAAERLISANRIAAAAAEQAAKQIAR